MATDLLKNIRTRIEKAGEIGKFPDWYITELLGFKRRWSTDFILDITDPKTGKKKAEAFKMVRVWHRLPNNRWLYGGGFRFHEDVTLSQMESHAIEMSFKGWIHGLKQGGSKGGIAFDPSKRTDEDLIAICNKAIEEAVEANVIGPWMDRWAPDVGTNELVMQRFQSRFAYEKRKPGTPEPLATITGKPLDDGGMPGRTEATGLGLHYAYEPFRKELKGKLPKNPTIILEGFGNVGSEYARLSMDLDKRKTIVGVTDKFNGIKGGVYCEKGLDIEKLLKYAKSNRTVQGFESEQKTASKAVLEEMLFDKGADGFVPAALEETVTEEVAKKAKIKFMEEGANGPTLPEADPILEERGITVIPDIYANAGGVIVSFFEWAQDTGGKPFDTDLIIPPSNSPAVVEIVYQQLQGAFTRNGANIINLQKQTKDGNKNISYRMASYIYAMDRVFSRFAAKRNKKI